MTETEKHIYGKKIFFLYPHSVIQNKMIKELICNGYESYIALDHEKILKILEEENDSILFINIDEVLQEPDWEQYVKYIMEHPKTNNTRIGILTYNKNNSLAEKYLKQLKVSCGFIILKLKFSESLKIILKILEFNEAKGRRKHVRAICNGNNKALFNVKINTKTYSGTIRDFSIAGMACYIDNNSILEADTRLNHIQLRLKGVPCITSGKVSFVRPDANHLHIIMFDEKMNYADREKIYNFVYECIQKDMEKKIREIK